MCRRRRRPLAATSALRWPDLTPIDPLVRLRAVRKALHLLHSIAQRESTFVGYSGHLLLAFCQIGTTSRSAAISQLALEMGRERAAHWKERWPETRQQLSSDNA